MCNCSSMNCMMIVWFWLMAAALRGSEVFLHRTDMGLLYRDFLRRRRTAAHVGPHGKGRLPHKSLGGSASPLKSTCRDAYIS